MDEAQSVDDDVLAGSVRRTAEDIKGDDDATVAIFPTKESGVEFLLNNNAWGFVRIKQNPDFVAMYVSGNANEVRYFAEVKEIVPADDAPLAKPPESYDVFDSTKKVVVFESESLYELENPIPYGERVPYSLRYTDLERFRAADTTDDLF